MIYTNIRVICKARKIPISKIERETGLSNGVIRKWDKASPSVWLLKAVADYLGTTVDNLLQPPENLAKG